MEKRYGQIEGIDYEEALSPTTKWATIHTLLTLEAQNRWKVHQMDVNIAFFNGCLKETVFMSNPNHFFVKGQQQKV